MDVTIISLTKERPANIATSSLLFAATFPFTQPGQLEVCALDKQMWIRETSIPGALVLKNSSNAFVDVRINLNTKQPFKADVGETEAIF